jgi:hypothetical protein
MKPGLQKPFFLVLLPAFFFIHVLNENFNPVLIKDAARLIVFYSVISLLITGIAWLLFRDLLKAALFAFCCLAIDFFFGPLQDLLQKKCPGHFLCVIALSCPSYLSYFSFLLFT